ncbi:hypothetical protein PoB_001422500 [Plakobranchus ocellatus]|uniref:Uncharacterized protein n=1 Tax=Plakobranchus ocellatus TaxID=259542 RepID=A0AAV3YXV9_9GAST|nr:hypothetical protein PoB_001422500 [Plakobranchus ocellatus]
MPNSSQRMTGLVVKRVISRFQPLSDRAAVAESNSPLDGDWFGFFCLQPVHNKVISGFQALLQARAPVLELATEGSLQISGGLRHPMCHGRPPGG